MIKTVKGTLLKDKKMIKKSFILVIIISTLFLSCKDSSKFKITKGKVGHLTAQTTIQDLDKIFSKDSIVKKLSEGSLGDHYFQDDDEYLIYEKGGKHLLTIIPKEPLDSTSTIKSVQVYDNRFKTQNGISLNATFSEINTKEKINKIETSFSSATLFLDDLNATIAIDKEQLGIKDFSTQKVSIDQIPDLAKIKTFIIWFN